MSGNSPLTTNENEAKSKGAENEVFGHVVATSLQHCFLFFYNTDLVSTFIPGISPFSSRRSRDSNEPSPI